MTDPLAGPVFAEDLDEIEVVGRADIHRIGRFWWVFALTGLGLTVFGILLIALPRTLLVIALVLGLALVFFGVLEVVNGFVLRGASLWWLYVLRGVATFGFGIVLVVWPDRTALVLAVVAGIYLLVAGLFELVLAIGLPDADHRGLYVLLAILAIVIGVFVLRDPARSLRLISVLLGAYLVFVGVLELLSSFGLRGLDRAVASD